MKSRGNISPSPLPQGEGATLLSGVFNARCDRGVSTQELSTWNCEALH